MSEFVSTWSHIEFPEPLELVRRDSLQPGDVAWSSHYGKRTVEKVSVRGTAGQTTYITWETPQAAPHPFSEAYDSESTIPLVSRAAAVSAALPSVEEIAAAIAPEGTWDSLNEFERGQYYWPAKRVHTLLQKGAE